MSTTPIKLPVIDDAKIVDDQIKNHHPLKVLRQHLIDSIATLNDSILKEQAVESTLLLLSHYNKIELYDEKITKFKPTTAPLPRSIRLSIELTCSEQDTRETDDFKSLQRDADLAKLQYQQKMRSLIINTMRLDRGAVLKELHNTFFGSMAMMIEMKVFFEFELLDDTSTFKATFKNVGGAKTAAGYICAVLLDTDQNLQPDAFTASITSTGKYLNMNRQEIVAELLSRFNKAQADTVRANSTLIQNESEARIRCEVKDIILFCLTKMTHEPLTIYKNDIRRRNALAQTKATFNAKLDEEATDDVVEVLATESSMSSQKMQDYIEKLITNKLDNTINNKIAKNLNGRRNNNNGNGKPASAKKGNQKGSSPTKKRKNNNNNSNQQKKNKPNCNQSNNNRGNNNSGKKKGRNNNNNNQNKNGYQGGSHKGGNKGKNGKPNGKGRK
jgi:hypothetical protein